MLVSCVEQVEYASIEESPLVVHCILTNDPVQSLDIRKVSGYGNQSVLLPDNIEAVLKNAAGETCCVFERKTANNWEAAFQPEYGRQYTLSIYVDSIEQIRATTTFPKEYYVMQFMKYRQGPLIQYLYCSCELRVPAVDDKGWKVLSGAIYRDKANLWIFPKDKDYIATTHPSVDNFNMSTLKVFDLPCFSRDSILTWRMEDNVGKRWIKEWYSDLPLFEQFVRIPFPKAFNNGEDPADISSSPLYTERSFILIANFPKKHSLANGRYFTVYEVSDELDLYLKSVYEKKVNKGRDMRLIYDHDNVYSNISGGVGIFGAFVARNEEKALRGYNGDFSE